MSEHDALLFAALREPFDLTARLVYADWLQENGWPTVVNWRIITSP